MPVALAALALMRTAPSPTPAQLQAVLAQLNGCFGHYGPVQQLPLPAAWSHPDPGLLRLRLPAALRRASPWMDPICPDYQYQETYCPPNTLDLRVRCSLPVSMLPAGCARAGHWPLGEEVLAAPAHAWLLLLPDAPIPAPLAGVVVLTSQLLAWLRESPFPGYLSYFGTSATDGYLAPTELAAGLPLASATHYSVNDWTQLRYC
ncbi:hypothetical protein [Hymenobacter sp. UYCo722]|uniref:hypothetical protein n=1 Tax=Hymenobacter sp. UYCo722 TaxID=3156335 RepID=UPI0033960D38